MNMLTGVSGNANEQIFYGNAAVAGVEGSLGKVEATAQIFPGGQSGVNEGEWKLVNKPINIGFMNIDNWVLEFVPSGTKFVGQMAKKADAGISGVEGVLMAPSIQAVGTGNVFNQPCPAGSIDDGITCRYPDKWEECGPGEQDTGMMCQSGGQFDGGWPPKYTPLNVRPKKLYPGKIVPKY